MNRHRIRHHHRRSPQSRVMIGIVIIAVGIVALLGNFGILDARSVLQFWPTIFIIIGTIKLSQSRHPAGYLVGGAFVATGLLMMLNNAGIIVFRMREWWPVFLILGGILILFKGMSRGGQESDDADCGMPGTASVEHGGRLNTTVVLSGSNVKSDAQDFRGGELTAVMGGIELNLRQASIQTEAVLNVFAFWGGISIKVPEDWSITINGMPLLGGIDDKTVPPMNPTKRLIIDGYAIMGGVDIRN